MKLITNKISNICKCGCGKRVSRPNNKYISGHNRKLPKEIRTCVCGCNRTFECKIKSKQVYITGHNRRVHPFPKSELCKCGCGQLTKPGNKSINGHNNRRKNYLEKTRVSKCLCGCNKLTSPGSKYIRGHAMRGRPAWNKLSRETRICKCGCKQTFDCRINSNRKYISGHNAAETLKRLWQNPEYRERQIKAMFAGMRIKPNKPERRLKNRLNHLFPNEYKFVGDGTFWIGSKNPDFININGQKKIIEMFGTYWHSEKYTGRTKRHEEQRRIRHFTKYGYRTLIVWQEELKDFEKLRRKLLIFHNTIIL